MISPLGDSVKEFGALSWSYEITFKSNSRELRFEEVRFDKLEYFLFFKTASVLPCETETLLAIFFSPSGGGQYVYSYVGSYSNR